MTESPQSFVVRQECTNAAWRYGFRRSLGEVKGWARFGSTTAQGTLHLAAGGPQGPWFLALDHPGVIAELDVSPAMMPGPGSAHYAFSTLGELHGALDRVYGLSRSLPDAPLLRFQAETAALPRTTEAERLVVQRIGQDVFRAGLLAYWRNCCPLTGITEAALLRASHIVPWSECADDAERLDVHNGLLLSALWDAAFDRALVSFSDAGEPLFSAALSPEARAALSWQAPLSLTERHRQQMTRHRARFHAADRQ